jgi:hypothetical protein
VAEAGEGVGVASQSEQAKAHRARQALRFPVSVGGFGFDTGQQSRRDRRLALSTKGKRAAEEKKADDEKILAAVAGRDRP